MFCYENCALFPGPNKVGKSLKNCLRLIEGSIDSCEK
jgi:hypothetical protein